MGKLPQANKDLGQHFLVDQKVIQKICCDYLEQAEAIVEVGPGPAVLSKHLASHHIPYYAVEKDQRFRSYLEEVTPSEHLEFTDALQLDWEPFFERHKIADKKIWLVSNLPYNISAPLLIRFLAQEKFQFMTLMFQKEVGIKSLMPAYQDKNCNSLGVLSNIYFECKKLSDVPGGCFSPPPKVDSIVISYQRKAEPLVPVREFGTLEKFLRLMFSQRRKQLKSVLKNEYNAQEREQLFTATEVPSTIRSEALSLDQVVKLYRESQKLS
jgi:16S rRNA (adenine1518-N6/adenine1519-N6)-dimethyltransferase